MGNEMTNVHGLGRLSNLRLRALALVLMAGGCGGGNAQSSPSSGVSPDSGGRKDVPVHSCANSVVLTDHDGSEIDEERARAIAVKIRGTGWVLRETEERAFGWAFSFQPRRFVETGDPNDLIPGPGPLIVHRADGVACEVGSFPDAVDNYERSWQEGR